MWPFRTSVKFTDMDFRTDVHSHILPGVDDGFGSEKNSVKALQLLHEIGLEHSILTPHIYPELYPANNPSSIRNRFSEVSDMLVRTGVECRVAGEHMVYAGVDSGFSEENAGSALLLGGRHILIEMSYAYESRNIRDFVFHLNAVGLHPVLAHPERYSYYSASLTEIRSIADMDTQLQLNILSLGGFYGNSAREKAEAMLAAGLYSFLGTDLHSVSQIAQLSSLKIEKKHVPAVERLLENNDRLWNGEDVQ